MAPNYYTDTNAVSHDLVESLMPDRKRIPDEVFKEVLKWLPIMTSDFIVTRLNSSSGKREFLLGYRAEAPFKDAWFVTGGRLNWGETTMEACKRHLKRELGLEGVTPRFVGQVSVMNPESATRPLWHSIWNLHEVFVAPDAVIKPNAENAKVGWFTKIEPSWPDPVREALQMIGFSE